MMRDFGASGKKPTKEAEMVRSRKPKLERLSPTVTKRKKPEATRKMGIDVLGNALWGTHFCLFYHTRQDLIDILVPYFKAGLENNEFCMWVTSEPLSAEDAKRSLKQAVRNLDGYIKRGQIEILDYSNWYTKTELFEADKVLQGWVQKHDEAIERGFDGLRLTGNSLWLEKKDWKKFTDYEEVVNSVIGKYRMLAICTYSLERCGASEILDVEHNHQFSLIKWKGVWKVLESSGRNQIEARLAEQTMIAEALQHSRKEWIDTFNAISDWVILVDLKGRILRTNRIGEEFTGVPLDEIIGQLCCKLVHGSEKHIPGCPLKKMLETGRRESAELQIPGTSRWLMVTVDPVTDAENNIIAAVHITRDITERKKAEEALRERERRFSDITENALEWIWETNANGKYIFASPVVKTILGYEPEEVLEKHFYDLFHPEDREELRKAAFEVFARREPFREFVNRNTHKSGKVVWLSTSAVPVLDEEGNFMGYRGADTDITDRKRTEERLLDYQSQLKSLASQLTLAEEHERHRIATELHDQIGQLLIISKLSLDAARNLGSAADITKALNEADRNIEQIIQNLRSLTFELSSPLLYELGLEKAVAEWLTEKIRKKHRINTEFEDDGQHKPLDDDLRALLFRDVRELLTNVVRHAQAKWVKVSIRKVESRICVTVEDNGWGFDPEKIAATATKAGKFGLFSIRERLKQLEGSIEIESAPGYGTCITLCAPLKQETENLN